MQGFLVIQSTRELDIVAVYTVAARDNVVTTLEMERVPPRPDLIVEVDINKTEAVRRIWPFFRDRRIDEFQDLLKRYGK